MKLQCKYVFQLHGNYRRAKDLVSVSALRLGQRAGGGGGGGVGGGGAGEEFVEQT